MLSPLRWPRHHWHLGLESSLFRGCPVHHRMSSSILGHYMPGTIPSIGDNQNSGSGLYQMFSWGGGHCTGWFVCIASHDLSLNQALVFPFHILAQVLPTGVPWSISCLSIIHGLSENHEAAPCLQVCAPDLKQTPKCLPLFLTHSGF